MSSKPHKIEVEFFSHQGPQKIIIAGRQKKKNAANFSSPIQPVSQSASKLLFS
jgi:hypothetical protein